MEKNKYRAWDENKHKMVYDGDYYSPFNYEEYELKSKTYPCEVTSKGIIAMNKLSENQSNDYIELTKGGKHQTYYCNWESEFLHKMGLILMQCVGFQDKNKKEIYEGDIVKSSREQLNKFTPFGEQIISAVEFEFGCFIVKNNNEYSPLANLEVEVIGNIYENPELINK